MTTLLKTSTAFIPATSQKDLTPEQAWISEIIPQSSHILDVGCGDGKLLDYLSNQKKVISRGLEISQKGVNRGVAKGLTIVQGDADKDLADYPSNAFDYVILSQVLPHLNSLRDTLAQMARIGRQSIISFSNFGHWKTRMTFVLTGQLPNVLNENNAWYDSPPSHPLTLKDFVDICDVMGICLQQGWYRRGEKIYPIQSKEWANIVAHSFILQLSSSSQVR